MGPVVIRQGLFRAAQVPLRATPIVVGIGEGRIQFDGPVVIRQGLFVPAQDPFRDAPIIVSAGIIRIQFDGPVVIPPEPLQSGREPPSRYLDYCRR